MDFRFLGDLKLKRFFVVCRGGVLGYFYPDAQKTVRHPKIIIPAAGSVFRNPAT
jgi:hypothetical protein